jgi:hypothetical protein
MAMMTMPPRINATETTQGLNSAAVIGPCSVAPITAAGRKASAKLIA